MVELDGRDKEVMNKTKNVDEHKDTRGYNTASNSQRQLTAKYTSYKDGDIMHQCFQ